LYKATGRECHQGVRLHREKRLFFFAKLLSVAYFLFAIITDGIGVRKKGLEIDLIEASAKAVVSRNVRHSL
jgi:hypothetical protein